MISEQVNKNKNPSENANIFNKLCYWWLWNICYKGVTKNLESKDLYEPVHSERSEVLGDQLEREWNKELEKKKKYEKIGNKRKRLYEPSLIRCITRIHFWSFAFQGFFMFVQNIILLNSRTFLLSWLIAYFEPGSTTTKEQAYYYAIGVVGTTIGSILAGNQTHYETARIGMKIRIACSSLIYRKTLKLSRTSVDQTGGGQIVNLMSNDVQKFDIFPIYFHHVWIAPIQFIVICSLIWKDVGLITLAGLLACIIQTVPVYGYISKISVQLRKKIALQTDKRVQLMNELISGIQVVKMYGWEKPFEQIIKSVREVELKLASMACHCRAFYLNGLVFTGRITVLVTLLTMVLTGSEINTKLVITISIYWQTLTSFMADLFPIAVVSAGDAHVSFQRVERYLKLDDKELEPQDFKTNSKSSNYKTDAISCTQLSANWIYGALPPTLCDLNFNIDHGQLCVLVGPVGSGKSSLLQSILKEIPTTNRTFNISGETISYAAQGSWIFGGTIQDNILFGLPYIKDRYDEVTRVCALSKDFQQLPQGHLTSVGDKGVSLSGGQRARINLARAVYRDADIYLLDDPLSAVDARVGRQLFTECINGYLRGKTRILVTHQLQYLRNADTIIVLKDGRVKCQGTFKSLTASDPDFANMVNSFHAGEEEWNAPMINPASKMQLARTSTSVNGSIDGKTEALDEEEVMGGRVAFPVYRPYFNAGGNIYFRLLAILVTSLATALASGTDYWVLFWANQEAVRQIYYYASSSLSTGSDNEKNDWISTNSSVISKLPELDSLLPTEISVSIYIGVLVSCIVFTIIRGSMIIRLCINSSRTLHYRMFENILRANMWFFNTNPSGRILNRFSKDIGILDETLPRSMLEVGTVFSSTAGSLMITIISNFWLAIPASIFSGICYVLRGAYLLIAQCVARLEGIAKSPVFSHVNYTLDGLLTIRSSGAQQRMITEFDRLQNLHTSASSINIATSHAFTFCINCLVTALISSVCFIFLILDNGDTKSTNFGLAVSQCILLTETIQFGLRKSVQVVGEMISTERVLQYTNLPKEGPFDSDDTDRPPSTWPAFGTIDIQNLSLKYDEEKPAVLKNINIHISHGQKIGIVGRTGAGKSSLIAAIFRLAKIEGSLKIDGIDTQTIGLHDLRSKISIIPQEPTLFKATVRYNLDPFNEFADDYLWAALDDVKLKTSFTSLDHEINDGGSNLSLGERQLVCLARAILKNNKIVVLDEATANVDHETDILIQKTIRRKFNDCTILTIAHRLSTIIDYDRVLVLDNGVAVEFDHPYILLKNPDGYFKGMIEETGNMMATALISAAKLVYDSHLK